MRILEVRDGFVKFEADETVCLSSFIQIDGIEKSYIAQVIQLKRSGENAIGYAKILFLYDGSLLNYDKTLPSKEAEIKEFTFEILSNSIDVTNPIIIGKTQVSDLNITIDSSAFDKKMLISIDDKNSNNLIVRNLVKQFNNLDKNVVIIDTLGIIEAKKLVAGVDFKLPLNTDSLAFMYQDCLNDATADSKSLIVEIFKDLAEYSKTVPFVPFEALKSIVDDMVDKSHVFKLLVLKNKLAKFDKLGYFAKNKHEVDSLKQHLNSKCTIIDLSKLDSAFMNRYLSFIYETMSDDSQVILELSNTASKKNIKDILTNNIATTFVTHSRFKYLNDIKNVFDNFVIMPSIANNEIFNIYSTFLKAMPKNTYLIAGEATNYIPLISPIKQINDTIEIAKTEDNLEQELENIVEDDIAPIETSSEIDELEQSEKVEEAEEEAFEEAENRISDEDILANIEEKSNDVISKATENLVAPVEVNMFDDSEEDDEKESNVVTQIVDELPETIMEDDTTQSDAPTLSEEDLQDNEAIVEEVPLAESFSTEIHQSEEVIEDYVPIEDFESVEEISLDDEFSDETEAEINDLQELETENISFKAEDLEETEFNTAQDNETEIELDEDINLDLEEQPELEISAEEPLTEESEKELSVMPLNDDLSQDDIRLDELNADGFEEITELNPDDMDDNDIIVDLEEEKELDENADEQIVKDVDKVFTTRKDDDISDSDLDFIDELNSDEDGVLEEIQDDSVLEELADSDEEDGILEEIQDAPPVIETKEDEEQEILETRNASTPIVPVYEADIPQEDIVMSDPIQQGDTVTHAKYGTGVVEKMIKYGNKTLFSINFDNIGRRLLDPTLTEIKKA